MKTDVLPAPALESVKYQNQIIDSTTYEKSPYSGNPSPEVDKAWNSLLTGKKYFHKANQFDR